MGLWVVIGDEGRQRRWDSIEPVGGEMRGGLRAWRGALANSKQAAVASMSRVGGGRSGSAVMMSSTIARHSCSRLRDRRARSKAHMRGGNPRL